MRPLDLFPAAALVCSKPRLKRTLAVPVLLLACDSIPDGPSLSRSDGRLRLGDQVPRGRERDSIGAISAPIARGARRFEHLRKVRAGKIVFKDEEGTGADRVMTRRLEQRLRRLSKRVEAEWPGVHLRVTEAWDEDGEHGAGSAHYEGRAADLTCSDLDPSKLGRLAWLAVRSGFDWVYYENRTHVHASVRAD